MKLNEYQKQARQFAVYHSSMGTATAGIHPYPYLGLAEEAGEVAGKAAKYFRDGAVLPVYTEAVKKELGDVLWMVANIAEDLGLGLEDIAETNIKKLEDRKNRGVIHGSGDNR